MKPDKLNLEIKGLLPGIENVPNNFPLIKIICLLLSHGLLILLNILVKIQPVIILFERDQAAKENPDLTDLGSKVFAKILVKYPITI
jgi:hypothetical protein